MALCKKDLNIAKELLIKFKTYTKKYRTLHDSCNYYKDTLANNSPYEWQFTGFEDVRFEPVKLIKRKARSEYDSLYATHMINKYKRSNSEKMTLLENYIHKILSRNTF